MRAIVLVLVAGCAAEPPLRAVPAPSCAAAIDGTWDERFVAPGLTGFAAEAHALVRAPDGRLVVGGVFERAIDVPVSGVAVWDGAAWSGLGDGLPGVVHALAYDDDGALWAAGDATPWEPGGAYLARWDGAAWTTVLDDVPVHAIVAVDGGVVIGGAEGASRWDGVAWHDLGLPSGSEITAIARDGDRLCIAGRIGQRWGVECQDGAGGWTALGGVLPGISTLARAPDGTWWVGGWFSEYAPDSWEVGGIARLLGTSWIVVDGGVADRGFFPFVNVRAVLFESDGVLVGGEFSAIGAGRVASAGLARWSRGTGWSPAPSTFGFDSSGARALLNSGERTLIAGGFHALGGTYAPNIAAIASDGRIEPLVGDRVALGGVARPLAGWNGALVASGVIAGRVVDAPLAVLDENWEAIDVAGIGDVQRALAHADGRLTVAADPVVQWTGDRWIELDGIGKPALLDADDRLYTIGSEQGIARFADGELTPLGVVDFSAVALAIDGGELVAAGHTVTPDADVGASKLAVRRDNRWTTIDAPLEGGVVAAASSPALGLLVRSGSGALAAWRDGAWRTLVDDRVTAFVACEEGAIVATREPDGWALRFVEDAGERVLATAPGARLITDLVLTDDGLWVGGDLGTGSTIALRR